MREPGSLPALVRNHGHMVRVGIEIIVRGPVVADRDVVRGEPTAREKDGSQEQDINPDRRLCEYDVIRIDAHPNRKAATGGYVEANLQGHRRIVQDVRGIGVTEESLQE